MTVVLILAVLVVIFLLTIFFQGGSPTIGKDFNNSSSREIIQQLSGGEKEQIKVLLRQSKKIEAIKICRSLTGCGLKDAKEMVEKLEREI
ncbi:ribosomal protein L7/L12 [Synechocystis salina LEGE 06099]|uniref:ribosomal protein bL12 n=1 Tax=Synechocystis salina TaxID=945780 RepID=UPI001880445F|nr:50S ribosomal protein L7/L12 [Synechocystis salina]MBE9204455.1 ribosomal protein L7/L12 [Synechocystis salina LEGE 06099]